MSDSSHFALQQRTRQVPLTLYRALDFAVLRSPALPVERYVQMAITRSTFDVCATLAPSDPEVRRALAIASPSLLDSLDRTKPSDDRAADLIVKLRRFLIRMTMRPTPFGTFAGVALVGWCDRTDLCLDGEPITHTRVDMDWLIRYVRALDMQPAIRNQLQWIANSAIWLRHGRLIKNGTQEVSVAATPLVCKALELARSPVPFNTLVQKLIADSAGATVEKVERLLSRLWDIGFLRTDLMPPVTIEEPIQWVRDRLASTTVGMALCLQLDALRRTVAECDQARVHAVPAALKRATAHLEMLGRSESRPPVQVDMALPVVGSALSHAVAAEAARVADLLLGLAPRRSSSSMLEGYRRAYIARYGEHREVPMLELLHPAWGLGPITGYLADSGNGVRRSDVLQQLALGAIRDGQSSIELDECLLKRLKFRRPDPAELSPSIELYVFVLAKSMGDIDAGEFQVLLGPNVGTTSAGRSLGRFTAVLGANSRAALARAARNEEAYYSGAIVTELAFLPPTIRSTNVTLRPAVRRYEITDSVSAGVDSNHVIPLSDLVIGLRDGRFYARWPSHDVDVIAMSGHMLNMSQAPPEHQLLTHISLDGYTQLGPFDWGPAGGYPFLPRVQSGRSILSCAQWRLDVRAQGDALIGSVHEFASWLGRWRNRWFVPRRVYLSVSDNRLLCDLDDPEQVEELRKELAKPATGRHCVLQEALPGPEHAWLRSSTGNHIVEMSVSLALRRAPPGATPVPSVARNLPDLPADLRICPPGSQWLYVKLYGPRGGEDELLAGAVRTLCLSEDIEKLTDGWFFVRYADPDRHLRLRFRVRSGAHEQLFPRLCRWSTDLVRTGLIQRVAFDTYERELERYGGPDGTDAAEALFVIDSRAVVELLARAASIDRETLMVITIDDLLSSLGLATAPSRLAWLRRTVKSRHEVGDAYRRKREQLVRGLNDMTAVDPEVATILTERRAALTPICARLSALQADGALTQPLERLFESFTHMHCNRVSGDTSLERHAHGLLLRARDTLDNLAKERLPSTTSAMSARDQHHRVGT